MTTATRTREYHLYSLHDRSGAERMRIEAESGADAQERAAQDIGEPIRAQHLRGECPAASCERWQLARRGLERIA